MSAPTQAGRDRGAASGRVALVLIGLALASLVPGLAQLIQSGAEQAGSAGQLDAPGGLGRALAALALTALAGRIALAWLPPGFPGEHGLGARDSGGLLATWAASHYLGLILLSLQGLIAASFPITASPWLAAAPWLVALAVRVTTLPADMVPRHGLGVAAARRPHERALTLLLVLAVLAPIVWRLGGSAPLFTDRTGFLGSSLAGAHLLDAPAASATFGFLESPALGLACLPALVLLLDHALAALGQSVGRRRAVLLLLVLMPTGLVHALAAGRSLGVMSMLPDALTTELAPALPRLQLAFGGAGAFGLLWLRRADRRAALLACLGFFAAVPLAPLELYAIGPGLAAAGLLALFFATPEAGRQRIVKPLGLLLALALGLAVLGHEAFALDSVAAESIAAIDARAGALATPTALLTSYTPWDFGLVLALVDVLWILLLIGRPWRPRAGAEPGDPRRRPRPALAFAFGLAALAMLLPLFSQALFELAFPWMRRGWLAGIEQFILVLAPSAVVLFALALDELAPREGRAHRRL